MESLRGLCGYKLEEGIRQRCLLMQLSDLQWLLKSEAETTGPT